MTPSNTGILVVGHGTRSDRGSEEFLTVAAELARRFADIPVEAGFLELAEPTIADAANRLLEHQVGRIIVAPILLFAAGHAKEDIPSAVRQALADRSDVVISQTEALGLSSPILRLAQLRCQRAIDTRRYVSHEETALIQVGRGSHDAEATTHMHAFASARAGALPYGRVATCFLSMAEPRLEAIIDEIGRQPFRRAIIQPHLLFHGELLTRLTKAVKDASGSFPHTEWVATPHLGAHPLVTTAIQELIWDKIA